MKPLTYGQLLEALNELPPEKLTDHVSIVQILSDDEDLEVSVFNVHDTLILEWEHGLSEPEREVIGEYIESDHPFLVAYL